jgi:hypothetical protein
MGKRRPSPVNRSSEVYRPPRCRDLLGRIRQLTIILAQPAARAPPKNSTKPSHRERLILTSLSKNLFKCWLRSTTARLASIFRGRFASAECLGIVIRPQGSRRHSNMADRRSKVLVVAAAVPPWTPTISPSGHLRWLAQSWNSPVISAAVGCATRLFRG